MAASVNYRQQEGGLAMALKEIDDELKLFLEMRSHEKENTLLVQSSDYFNDQLGSVDNSSGIPRTMSALSKRDIIADDFLASEADKTDYDWLLSPPATPLFPSLDMELKKSETTDNRTLNPQPAGPNPKLTNNPSQDLPSTRQPVLSNGLSSFNGGNRRPSSSGGLKSTANRPATPTGRAAFPAMKKSSSRPSTPTSRAALPSARSSTPTRPLARSSTPTARPSVPAASKPASRSTTPARRSSAPASLPCSNSGQPTLKKLVPSRGISPTVKSRPSKASDNAPPSSKPSMPQRPVSASKVRPRAPCSTRTSSSVKDRSNGRPRQQSMSPSRGWRSNEESMLAKSRANPTEDDDVNPILIGTKMVERVVNMRKLAPPKQDGHLSNHNQASGKSSSSQDSSGFGRTLSKKSLDMALRHLDIRRGIPGNLRIIMTNVPVPSVHSSSSGSNKSRTESVSDSPLATSSNASSEPSVNNNFPCLDV